ncbi:MAG: hypothetical protein R6V06_07510 [Kiritimatiellia bacterium]
MNYIAVILNIFIAILLVRLFSKPDRETFFNPFVSFTNSRVTRLVDFLKPALALPEKTTMGIILLFVFLFKTLLLSKMAHTVSINFGEVFRVVPPDSMSEHISLLYFSFLETISFMLKFWSFYFLTILVKSPGKSTRALQALGYYAKPFSLPPLRFQILLLVVSHIALAFLAIQSGELVSISVSTGSVQTISDPVTGSPMIIGFIKTAWIGLLSVCEGISVMISVLFTFIIGSLITTLMRRMDFALLCREGMDMVLGRFSRSQTPQAGLDFTPLIFFFVASISYNTVNFAIFSLVNTDLTLPF